MHVVRTRLANWSRTPFTNLWRDALTVAGSVISIHRAARIGRPRCARLTTRDRPRPALTKDYEQLAYARCRCCCRGRRTPALTADHPQCLLLRNFGDSCRRAPALTAIIPATHARLLTSLRTRWETAPSTRAEMKIDKLTAWLCCVAWLREYKKRRLSHASCEL